MIRLLFSYIRHLGKSFHLHGIHSPFVFQFQHQVVYGDTPRNVRDEILRFRESIKNNPQTLRIKDYGSGSKKLNHQARQVTDILRHNCSPPDRCELMYRICKRMNALNVLELGTSLGVTAHAASISGAQVDTVEGCPNVATYATERLAAYDNATVHNQTFDHFIANHSHPSYDIIFIDGYHDKNVLRYVERLLPYTHNDSIIILDDIYWSNEMTHSWRELRKLPQVTASIDSFYWGFLFLRKEQQQEFFSILLGKNRFFQ